MDYNKLIQLIISTIATVFLGLLLHVVKHQHDEIDKNFPDCDFPSNLVDSAYWLPSEYVYDEETGLYFQEHTLVIKPKQ